MKAVALRRLATLATDCPNFGRRPFLALENLEAGTGRLSVSKLPERDAPEAGAAAVEPGDVLYGKLRPYLAKSWLADRPVYASTELLALRPRPGVESRWLAYVCGSKRLVEWSVATSDGAKMPRTSWEKLGQFRLDVPSETTQHAIADFLDAETGRIDSLIQKKRQLLKLIGQRRRGRLDRFLDVGHEVRLRHAVTRLTSGPRGWAGYVSDEGSLFLRIANVRRDSIELDLSDAVRVAPPADAEAARTRVLSGDVLLSITADIGSVGLAREEHHGAYVSQHIALLTPSKCSGEWLAHALSTSFAQGQLDAARYGGTKTQLALEDVAEVVVSIPPESTQEQVMRNVHAVTQTAGAANIALLRQITLLREHRQALITAAVAGQLGIAKAVA